MQTKEKVGKSRIKIKKSTKSKKAIYKNIHQYNKQTGLKGPATEPISPEDLLDEILSKWLG